MRKDNNGDLSEIEDRLLLKIEKLEHELQVLRLGKEDADMEEVPCFPLDFVDVETTDGFTDEEFSPSGLRSVAWSGGKWADHSTRLLTCNAMIVTYFRFELWEDGQFQASAYGRNRSKHARWIFKLKIKFQELMGPSPDVPGSHRELFWLGAKKRSDHSAVETGRYAFGKENFERMRRGELRPAIYGKCKRTG